MCVCVRFVFLRWPRTVQETAVVGKSSLLPKFLVPRPSDIVSCPIPTQKSRLEFVVSEHVFADVQVSFAVIMMAAFH